MRALCIVAGLLLAGPASALITVGGKEPVSGDHWPAGCARLANLPTRVSYWEGPPLGGGQYTFQFVCARTDQFLDALKALSAVQAPARELVVMDGPKTDTMASAGQPRQIHFEFEVWDTRSFHTLNHDPRTIVMSDAPEFRQPLPAPRLTVYLGQGNPIDWNAVRVPDNIQVLDRRVATSPYAESAGGVVRCTLYDMTTGRPIPDAQVSIRHYEANAWKDVATPRTDARGVAVAQNLPAGSYAVVASHAGHAARHLGYVQNLGRTLALFDDARLSPAATLSGRAVDAEGAPLAGVQVRTMALVGLDGFGYSTDTPAATTDAAGRFTLAGLPTGYCSLRATKEGYYAFSFQIYPIPGPAMRLTMSKTGSLAGRVQGAERKRPGQTVNVTIEPEGDPVGKWGGTARAADDGTYTLEGVPAGTYLLHASVEGQPAQGPSPFLPNDDQPLVRVEVKPGQPTQADVVLR